jgi:hypothetical protein
MHARHAQQPAAPQRDGRAAAQQWGREHVSVRVRDCFVFHASGCPDGFQCGFIVTPRIYVCKSVSVRVRERGSVLQRGEGPQGVRAVVRRMLAAEGVGAFYKGAGTHLALATASALMSSVFVELLAAPPGTPMPGHVPL